MEDIIKMRCTKFLLVILTMGGLQACHKSPMKSEPMPVKPIPTGAWKRVTSLPGVTMQAMEVFNNTLFVGSDLGLIYSSADGITWTTSNGIQPANPITAIAVLNNKLFAGSAGNGIYRSTDGGKSWSGNSSSSNFQKVSSFAILNGTLYSGSAAYSGIVVYNEASDQWSPFVNGLPTNYNTDVQKIIPFNNTLLSVQGVNGNYYLFNQATNYWTEQYFLNNTYSPGLWVNDVIYDSGTLYAAYDNAVLSSKNGGVNWLYDTVGLRRADLFNRRVIYAGKDRYYTINNTRVSEIWLQQRSKLAQPGSTWATGEDHLYFGHSYSVREFNNILFLAADSGLYFKKLM